MMTKENLHEIVTLMGFDLEHPLLLEALPPHGTSFILVLTGQSRFTQASQKREWRGKTRQYSQLLRLLKSDTTTLEPEWW